MKAVVDTGDSQGLSCEIGFPEANSGLSCTEVGMGGTNGVTRLAFTVCQPQDAIV